LGDEIRVPTLDGEEKVVIAAGTPSGEVIRLRNKGVPHLRRNGRGDQFVVINVKIPTQLTAEQRRLMTEFGKTLGAKSRPNAKRDSSTGLKIFLAFDYLDNVRFRLCHPPSAPPPLCGGQGVSRVAAKGLCTMNNEILRALRALSLPWTGSPGNDT